MFLWHKHPLFKYQQLYNITNQAIDSPILVDSDQHRKKQAGKPDMAHFDLVSATPFSPAFSENNDGHSKAVQLTKDIVSLKSSRTIKI